MRSAMMSNCSALSKRSLNKMIACLLVMVMGVEVHADLLEDDGEGEKKYEYYIKNYPSVHDTLRIFYFDSSNRLKELDSRSKANFYQLYPPVRYFYYLILRSSREHYILDSLKMFSSERYSLFSNLKTTFGDSQFGRISFPEELRITLNESVGLSQTYVNRVTLFLCHKDGEYYFSSYPLTAKGEVNDGIEEGLNVKEYMVILLAVISVAGIIGIVLLRQ